MRRAYSDDFGAYYLQIPIKYSSLTKSIKEQFNTLARQFPSVKFIQNNISTKDNWISKMKHLFTEEISAKLADQIGLLDNSVLFLGYGEKNQVVRFCFDNINCLIS